MPGSYDYSFYSAFCAGTPLCGVLCFFVFFFSFSSFPFGCCSCLPLPLQAGVCWAEQQHQLWKRGRESVCGLHFNCFITFQRKDLRHWDSKRLLMPPVNSLYISNIFAYLLHTEIK